MRICLVDDETSLRRGVAYFLKGQDYEVVEAEDGESGWALCRNGDIDLVLTDVKMPNLDGLGLLDRIHAVWPALPVVVMTAYASIEDAVEAMQRGAADYLTKPVNLKMLGMKMEAIGARLALSAENSALKKRLARWEGHEMRGDSAAMASLRWLIERAASDAQAPVLITGESGTGKELAARAIHQNSTRQAGPFVAVNCAALPETLMESELFGVRKGAFSGAIADREGFFQAAHGGTLLLDEIGEMAPAMQAKLLRVLQEGQVHRLGDPRPRPVDVRVLAASNQPLVARIAEGQFREDLYYRLAVLEMTVPPLRDRIEDIPLLVDHFNQRFHPDKEPLRFSAEAMERLMAYGWPGNIRELENLVRRLGITAIDREVRLDDLPGTLRTPGVPALFPDESWPLRPRYAEALARVQRRFERVYLEHHLTLHGRNVSQTAQAVGLSRGALHRKIKELNL